MRKLVTIWLILTMLISGLLPTIGFASTTNLLENESNYNPEEPPAPIILHSPSGGGIGNESNVSQTVYGNVSDSVYRSNLFSSTPEYPQNYDQIAARNINIKTDQAPYSIKSGGGSVSTLTGGLSVTSTDLVLPGRNGLSFALTRSYDSTSSQFYDMDTENHDIFYYAVFGSLNITYDRKNLAGTEFYAFDSVIINQADLGFTPEPGKILGKPNAYERNNLYVYPESFYAYYVKENEINSKYSEAYSNFDYWQKNQIGPVFTIPYYGPYNDGFYYKAWASYAPLILSPPRPVMKKLYTGIFNKTIDKSYEENIFPIGKGWSWNISSIQSKNGKRYLHLANRGSYEINGSNQLVGYPWKDLVLYNNTSVTVNNETSSHELRSLDKTSQYFNGEGRLIRIADVHGNTVDFTYSQITPYGKVLTSIKDAIGNTINISYTSTNVVLTQDDKTVTYNKQIINGKEFLGGATDSQGRTTSYSYQVSNAQFNFPSNTNANQPANNPYGLLKTITHPTGAKTQYRYEANPVTRYFGPIGYNQAYRVHQKWEETAGGSGGNFNFESFSYSGDIGTYGSSYNLTTTVDNGRTQKLYQNYKQHVNDDIPATYYTQKITERSGNLSRIELRDYDYSLYRSVPKKSTTYVENIRQDGSVEKTEFAVTRWEFDEYGNITSRTDPNNNVTLNSYDSSTHLLKNVVFPVQNGLSQYMEIERYPDTNRIMEIRIKENGSAGTLKAQTSYTYDARGNPSTVTIKDDDGRLIVVTNSYANLVNGVDYNGGYLTSQSIVATNYIDNVTETLTQSFEYNKSTGELTRSIDGNGNDTEYSYDLIGRLKQIKYPDNGVLTLSYDDTLHQLTVVDPTGVASVTKWNEFGWKKSSGLLGKNPEEYDYDNYGRLLWYEDGGNNRTNFVYDNWNRLVITKHPGSSAALTCNDNAFTCITYDDINQTVTTKDEEGNIFKEYYDLIGRISRMETFNNSNQLTSSVKYSYDFAGNIESLTNGVTDPIAFESEKTTQYLYDVLSRLVSVQDPDGYLTKYKYSLANQLTEIEYPDGNKVQRKYDELGRLVQKKDPSGQIEMYAYDNNSNLTKVLDRNGQTKTYSYNNRNLLTSSLTSDETITYDYDTAGRRLWVQSNTERTTYSYDATTGWLTNVGYPDSRSIQYEYNNDGQRTKMTDPFGIVTVYDYDSRNRLRAVGPSLNIWDVQYDYKDNNLLSKLNYLNGISVSYGYDEMNLITLNQTRSGGQSVNSFAYDYDLHRNIKSKSENSTTNTFTYDKLNRIAASTQFNEQYFYDARGNRTSHLSSKPITFKGGSYQYDNRNRLKQVSLETGVLVSYKYNGDGLLYERTENGTTTRYYYDGENMVAEGTVGSTGATVHKASYIRGKQLIARVDANGGKTYYLHNGHGDVVGLTDGLGNVLNQYTYDIWGNPITEHEMVENPFRYSGEFWDSSAELQYLRARWYDPDMGRFINEDTYEGDISNPLSLNLYTYVSNNPLRYIDPSGHMGCALGSSWCNDYFSAAGEYFTDKLKMATDKTYRATKAVADFLIVDDINTIIDPNASTFDKTLSAASFTPVGKLIKGGKLVISLENKYKTVMREIELTADNWNVAKYLACNCFTAGTKVLTDEGEKNIEDIQVGDKVLSKDENTGEVAYKEITATFNHETDEIYKIHVNDQVIESTFNHPFWVDGKGWTFVKDLKIGDLLVQSDGNKLKIESIELEHKHVIVYNMTVDEFHTYFVSDLGIWVHNTGPCRLSATTLATMGKTNRGIAGLEDAYISKDKVLDTVKEFVGEGYSMGVAQNGYTTYVSKNGNYVARYGYKKDGSLELNLENDIGGNFHIEVK
ncbi:polymorphic toxin-type HINT domain-containing protein [Paenibacillus sp. GYB004]|uniref:polymorphic toxin-type HINT domain-containing protein n=1 Tax=Paenibacillus sp. GYB004 TaxID=2994393 RepID=UPI002F960D7F